MAYVIVALLSVAAGYAFRGKELKALKAAKAALEAELATLKADIKAKV